MGTPVLKEQTVIVPVLWYKVSVIPYTGPPWEGNCNDEAQDMIACCVIGEQVTHFFDFDMECFAGWEMCPFTGFSAQRIVAVYGPYTTREDCFADL